MSDTALALTHTLTLQGYNDATLPTLIMGEYDAAFAAIPRPAYFLTPYKGSHDRWNAAGFKPHAAGQIYKLIIMQAARGAIESDSEIALAADLLDKNGRIVIAAPNDSGGRTLKKRMEQAGFAVTELSKHKCRIVWGTRLSATPPPLIPPAAHIHQRSDGLWTQAGVFSWDKPDKGTAALMSFIGTDIVGNCADFGAGIGALGHVLLTRNEKVTHLDSFEHDIRAINCAHKNLSPFGVRTNVIWDDITTHNFAPEYDVIIMNPPFHEGRIQNFTLGHLFITKAASALKKGGQLLMVANTHLPYEDILSERFSRFENLGTHQGFKILRATL